MWLRERHGNGDRPLEIFERGPSGQPHTMARAARVGRELVMLAREPPHGISCWTDDGAGADSLENLQAQVVGPADTPYEGGVFRLSVQVRHRFSAAMRGGRVCARACGHQSVVGRPVCLTCPACRGVYHRPMAQGRSPGCCVAYHDGPTDPPLLALCRSRSDTRLSRPKSASPRGFTTQTSTPVAASASTC